MYNIEDLKDENMCSSGNRLSHVVAKVRSGIATFSKKPFSRISVC